MLTLGPGIGAGTTVFSDAQALLMLPLPYRDAERLAEVSLSTQGGTVFLQASESLSRAVAEQQPVVQGVAGTLEEGVSLRAADGPRVANGVLVKDDHFGVMGVRPGLGRWPAASAEAPSVLRMVMKWTLGLTAWGVLTGLVAALVLTRVLASQLYGVSPTDPATFAVVVILLVSAALFASWFPARRASKVDPMIALRQE